MRAPPQGSCAAILVRAWEKAQPSTPVDPKSQAMIHFVYKLPFTHSQNRKLKNKLKKFEKKQESFKTDPFIGKLPHEYFVPIIFRKNTILSKMIKKMIHFVKKMIHL